MFTEAPKHHASLNISCTIPPKQDGAVVQTRALEPVSWVQIPTLLLASRGTRHELPDFSVSSPIKWG